jgi:2-polyprenyl-6-methoxyphenol hydroxylase-like FAD-dependent oxidoreductase
VPHRVIVVGAAVAGSAMANALGQLGIPTLVVEKGAERDNSTRGDILHPPTLAFLDRWEVLGDLHADGALPLTQIAVTSRSCGRLATYPIAAAGEGPAARSVAVPHDRIEAVMKAAAERWPSVEIERATVVGLERNDDGRVAEVRARTAAGERVFRAPLVVGCDGSQSLVRRELGIPVDRQPYDHEFLYIAADGPTDPPAAMHFYLDRQGVIMVASRPGRRMRIAIYFARGARGDLLKRPDPALHEYVAGRVPALAAARFGRANAHVYSLVRQLALRFSAPGAALVGDAAHTTHPAGATGMNLAISGAARLAELLGPLLLEGSETPAQLAALDGALTAYDAERRPAAALAVEHNHRQALRIWPPHPEENLEGYARAANPASGWGVGGAGWGQDPAALGPLAVASSGGVGPARPATPFPLGDRTRQRRLRARG